MKSTIMNPRLIAYSGAAAALLASGRSAHAQIVYTDIFPDSILIADPDADFEDLLGGFDGWHQMYLDVDGTGGNDIRIKLTGYTYVTTDYINYATAVVAEFEHVFGDELRLAGQNTGISMCCTPPLYPHYFLSRFSQGVDIGDDEIWDHPWYDGAVLFASNYVVSGLFSSGTNYGGYWGEPEIEAQYVGFRTGVAPNYKYGWVRLSVECIQRTPGVLGSKYYKLVVHDYAINMVMNDPLYAGEGLPDCLVPLPADPLGITASTAKLKWAPVYAADNYQIYIRPAGGVTWQKITAATNQKKVTGLLCNTEYEWKVRTSCDGEKSAFSAMEGFTTASCRLVSEHDGVEATVFPNPVSQVLNIDVSELDCADCHIEIRDLTGRKMSETTMPASTGSIVVDMSAYATGVYVVIISSGDFRQTLKVVRQ